jgi:hypothetical protein
MAITNFGPSPVSPRYSTTLPMLPLGRRTHLPSLPVMDRTVRTVSPTSILVLVMMPTFL